MDKLLAMISAAGMIFDTSTHASRGFWRLNHNSQSQAIKEDLPFEGKLNLHTVSTICYFDPEIIPE